MTATQEIRDTAKLFGWDSHKDEGRREDTFTHGQHVVAVDYSRDGSVRQGARSEFFQITQPRLKEITGDRHKKSDVLGWLVRFGH